VLAVPFFLFVLFPYLRILPLPTDTQPNAMLFAAAIWLAMGPRTSLPLPVWSLLGLFLFSLVLVDPVSLTAWRSSLGYASLFLIAAATLVLSERRIRLSDAALDVAAWIWFAVGAAQLVLDRTFLTGLVAEARTSPTRGVTALATEPSHYGTIALLLLVLLLLRRRETSLVGLACVVQVLLFAQSAQVALVLVLALIAYGVLVRPIVLAGAVLAGLWTLAVFDPFSTIADDERRIVRLAVLLVEDPWLLVLADPSGSQRLASILLSFKGMLDHGLLPGGLNSFAAYMAAEVGAWRSLLHYAPTSDRISSGYGSAAYELGVFGLAIPLVIAIGIVRFGRRGGLGRGIVAQVAVHATMVTAVPLALPLIGFLIGTLYAGDSPEENSASASANRRRPSADANRPTG